MSVKTDAVSIRCQTFLTQPRRAAGILGALVLGLMMLSGHSALAEITSPAEELQAAMPAPEITDDQITAAVNTALMVDPGVSSYLVDVKSTGGIVHLSGIVNNILARERALAVSETVKGVRSVINEIEVRTAERTDVDILRNVEDALLLDPAADAYEIDVAVDDGTVLLSGTVDSWQEKQLAGTVAKGVAGVTALQNAIEINWTAGRLDHEIEKEIEAALKWDVLVDRAMIDVTVEDGQVTLSGAVGSAAEARRAGQDAWVAGVESVDRSGLDIEHWSRSEGFREKTYVDVSDENIELAILDAYLYDPRVNMFEVDVTVEDGTVTLEGTVNNLKAKRAASQDARNTTGVWQVENRLLVRVPDMPADRRIADSLKTALLRDPLVDRFDITVSVINGEAYLRGTVDTYFEKLRAQTVAEGIPGVIEVNNIIDVNNEFNPLTHDPYIDHGWDFGDTGWYLYPRNITTRLSDWEILERIRDELWWSPFVDEDQVTVSVNNGEATLSGTVETWSERAAAEKNAYDGGAVSVDNDLTVIFGPAYYMK